MEISQTVFSWAEDDYGPLSDTYQLFVAVCEAVIRPDDFAYAKWSENGRLVNNRHASPIS